MVFYFYIEVKKRKIDENFLINLIFNAVLFGIIGARLYYVAFNMDYYMQHPIEIFEIWNGGLAIHGGLIAGFLVTVLCCKKEKQNLLEMLDIIVVGLIIGQAIGRWGNFFNSEAYGAAVSLKSLQSQGVPDFVIQGMYIMGEYHEPAFLYESICTFIIFLLLYSIRNKRKYRGQITYTYLFLYGFGAMLIIRRFYRYLKIGQLTGFYLMWYSSARFLIEGIRLDSLMLGNFKIAQIVSIVLFLTGLILFIVKGHGSNFENLYNRTGGQVNESSKLPNTL